MFILEICFDSNKNVTKSLISIVRSTEKKKGYKRLITVRGIRGLGWKPDPIVRVVNFLGWVGLS